MNAGNRNRSLAVAGIVAGLFVAVRLISTELPERTGRVDPHVNLEANQYSQTGQIAARQKQQEASAFVAVTEGEVYRTEERMRELTALATSASLFAASEALHQRAPQTVGALLSGVEGAGLLPPGLELIDGEGEVSSVHGKLFVRYRPEPFGVEVVSMGQERMDGPAMLIRTPGEIENGAREGDAGGKRQDGNPDLARLFVATRLEEIAIPAPFVDEAEVIALGFSPEPLRAAKLPKPDTGK